MCAFFPTMAMYLLYLSAFAQGNEGFLESCNPLQPQVRNVVVPLHPWLCPCRAPWSSVPLDSLAPLTQDTRLHTSDWSTSATCLHACALLVPFLTCRTCPERMSLTTRKGGITLSHFVFWASSWGFSLGGSGHGCVCGVIYTMFCIMPLKW